MSLPFEVPPRRSPRILVNGCLNVARGDIVFIYTTSAPEGPHLQKFPPPILITTAARPT